MKTVGRRILFYALLHFFTLFICGFLLGITSSANIVGDGIPLAGVAFWWDSIVEILTFPLATIAPPLPQQVGFSSIPLWVILGSSLIYGVVGMLVERVCLTQMQAKTEIGKILTTLCKAPLLFIFGVIILLPPFILPAPEKDSTNSFEFPAPADFVPEKITGLTRYPTTAKLELVLNATPSLPFKCYLDPSDPLFQDPFSAAVEINSLIAALELPDDKLTLLYSERFPEISRSIRRGTLSAQAYELTPRIFELKKCILSRLAYFGPFAASAAPRLIAATRAYGLEQPLAATLMIWRPIPKEGVKLLLEKYLANRSYAGDQFLPVLLQEGALTTECLAQLLPQAIAETDVSRITTLLTKLGPVAGEVAPKVGELAVTANVYSARALVSVLPKISRSGDPLVILTLRRLVTNKDATVAEEALQALAQIETDKEALREQLLELIGGNSASISAKAVTLYLQSAPSAESLMLLIRSKGLLVSEVSEAVRALAQFGKSQTAHLLEIISTALKNAAELEPSKGGYRYTYERPVARGLYTAAFNTLIELGAPLSITPTTLLESQTPLLQKVGLDLLWKLRAGTSVPCAEIAPLARSTNIELQLRALAVMKSGNCSDLPALPDPKSMLADLFVTQRTYRDSKGDDFTLFMALYSPKGWQLLQSYLDTQKGRSVCSAMSALSELQPENEEQKTWLISAIDQRAQYYASCVPFYAARSLKRLDAKDFEPYRERLLAVVKQAPRRRCNEYDPQASVISLLLHLSYTDEQFAELLKVLGGLPGTALDRDELRVLHSSKNLTATQYDALLKITERTWRRSTESKCLSEDGVTYVNPEGSSLTWLLSLSKANKEEILKVLQDKRININARDYGCLSALHQVVISKDYEFVPILLEAGASPNLPGREGMTPLALAAQNGDIKTVQLLLEHKAKVNVVDSSGGSILTAALTSTTKSKEVVAALLKAGADPELGTDSIYRNPPLLQAYVTRQLDSFNELLNAARNLEITNGAGDMIAHLAARNGDEKLLATLKERGVSMELVNCSGELPVKAVR